MITLNSSRLKLIALDNQLLTIWSNKGRSFLENSLGLKLSNLQINEKFIAENKAALFDFWLPMTSKYPYYFGWFTHWEIIHVAENLVIGGLGFSNFPDENGQTQIGYYISQSFINQGFATEAVGKIISWAEKEPALKCINAETFQDNLPSQKILMANGFKQTGIINNEENKDVPIIKWQKLF